jgi:hypothetical protein
MWFLKSLAADSGTERGQGLNNAMKNACNLVDAVKAFVAGERALRDVITTHEAEMKPRGATEVALSMEQA